MLKRAFNIGTVTIVTLALAACGTLGGADATATAQAEATGTAAFDATAEAVAQQTQDAVIAQTAQAIQVLSVTATAYAPVFDQLAAFGFTPEDGVPGWIHQPIDLSIEGFQQTSFANDFGGLPLTDFVISSDITMITDFGLTGCGFILRSDGDEEEPSQYVSLITRGGNGSIAYVRQINGEFEFVEIPTIAGTDLNFDAQNGATNELTIVAEGGIITYYTNGTQVGTFSGAELATGGVAMVAVSESGRTQCQFNDTWMYIIGEAPEIPEGFEGGNAPTQGQGSLGDGGAQGQLPEAPPLDFPTPTPRSE